MWSNRQLRVTIVKTMSHHHREVANFIHKESAFMQKRNWKALAPIGVFLFMYLGLGLLFEYRLMIPMGFYNIPIVAVQVADHALITWLIIQ